jgi:hypothetical protein
MTKTKVKIAPEARPLRDFAKKTLPSRFRISTRVRRCLENAIGSDATVAEARKLTREELLRIPNFGAGSFIQWRRFCANLDAVKQLEAYRFLDDLKHPNAPAKYRVKPSFLKALRDALTFRHMAHTLSSAARIPDAELLQIKGVGPVRVAEWRGVIRALLEDDMLARPSAPPRYDLTPKVNERDEWIRIGRLLERSDAVRWLRSNNFTSAAFELDREEHLK